MALILLDLDDTLIDVNYQLTIPVHTVRAAVYAAEKAGWHIGISSDTPIDTCRHWLKTIGGSGPIIAERGALVTWPKYRIYQEATPGLSRFFFTINQAVRAFLRNKYTGSYRTGDAQVAAILKQNPHILWEHCPSQLLLHNTVRRGSFSLFVYHYKNGKYRPNPAGVLHIAAELRRQIPYRLWWDINPNAGVIIVHHKQTHKRVGLKRLLQQLPPRHLQSCWMVGNSMSDYLGPLCLHAAVANAKDTFKKQAAFTGSHHLSLGVAEIIQLLTRTKGRF